MIWVAIIIEAAQGSWLNFGVLFFLQTLNGLVSFVEEKNAGDAVAALKNALAPVAEVKRNGKWQKINARELVPGDLIQLKIGDVIPADGLLCEGDPIQVDQAALTGESLPVTVWPNQDVKMGSSVKRGETETLVTATGGNTFLGRAASLVANVESQGRFQKVMFRITLGLLSLSLVLCSIIFGVLYTKNHNVLSALGTCVVLLVASIPIAMQVVCTSTMAVGSRRLAAKGAIVSRLSAIEELAGMRVLCSDKTGTLTKNELILNDPILFGECTGDELVLYSALATKRTSGQDRDAIDTVIVNSVPDQALLDSFEQLTFVPFNPTDKRTEAVVRSAEGVEFQVAKGAPQVILEMCKEPDRFADALNESVVRLADRGYRPVAVGKTNEDGDWEVLGVLSLFDPPRDDTALTIKLALQNGVEVKMITGDHTLIAKETARRLDMGANIYSVEALEAAEDIGNTGSAGRSVDELVRTADGFAEVFPEHKYRIVDVLRNQGLTTGMTGDGVNDAPALKRADIGIAVEGSTDAARSAADIVLTEPGLMTIIDAIIRSRMIFQRMRNYCLYRIACSLQLLVFFFASVVAFDPALYFSKSPSSFTIPVIALVLITVLNDGTIITISHDNVTPSTRPEAWRLLEVAAVSVTLGAVNAAASLTFLYEGFRCGDKVAANSRSGFTRFLGNTLTYEQLVTLLYLQVSVGNFLTVFAARTKSHSFSRRPGYALLTAFVIATTTSSLLAGFWPTSGTVRMAPISGSMVGFVWLYAIATWLIQDILKLLVYQAIDYFNVDEEKDLAEAEKRKMMSTAIESERRTSRLSLTAEEFRHRSMAGENSFRKASGSAKLGRNISSRSTRFGSYTSGNLAAIGEHSALPVPRQGSISRLAKSTSQRSHFSFQSGNAD